VTTLRFGSTLLVLDSAVILGSGPHRTHDHIFLSRDSESRAGRKCEAWCPVWANRDCGHEEISLPFIGPRSTLSMDSGGPEMGSSIISPCPLSRTRDHPLLPPTTHGSVGQLTYTYMITHTHTPYSDNEGGGSVCLRVLTCTWRKYPTAESA
jgi:hypothetical protein